MAAIARLTITLIVALASLACAVEVPAPDEGEPMCMLAVSVGHWDDGTSHVILDPTKTSGGHPVGCGCLPPEDRYAWDDETLEQLAAIAVEECERIAETYYDFDWNDCRADYEARVLEELGWPMVYVGPDSDWAIYDPPELRCIPPE